MTKRQKQAHIQMLQSLVAATGFEQDRYSNWKRELENGTIRIKFKSTNIRIELKLHKDRGWMKLVSKPIVRFDNTDITFLMKLIKHYDTPRPVNV